MGTPFRLSGNSSVFLFPGEEADVIHEIGKAAGDIWQVLHKEGEVTLAKLRKSVPAQEEVFLMALGWLAREDQLDFTRRGRSVRITLRRPD